MSRRIFLDVEEALAREIRRLTFHDQRTLSHTVLQDLFDPITGEIIQTPVQADFYDSSADASHIQYPNFTIKLLSSREDRFSGRELSNYGRGILTSVKTAQKAYEIVINGSDGQINPVGSTLKTSIYSIKKVQVGHLLRIVSGNNQGTYKVASISVSNSGPHSIVVSNELVTNLSAFTFNSSTRELTFDGNQDLNTVKIGDNFVDSLLASFSITSIDAANNKIIIGGVATPSTLINGKITRTGNVFQTVDLSLVKWFILDPTKPIMVNMPTGCTPAGATEGSVGVSPSIPLDLYYLIRIDSKERANHIDVINRIWEEFNPPRTGLPIVVRSSLSFEQLLTVDVTSGGSFTLNVSDNSGYKLNETVFIFDNLSPSKDLSTEGFQSPFTAKIVSKVGTTQIVLDTLVPDSYLVSNSTKIVSNATLQIAMFHFVNHVTKDVDGSQYWVHELTFWVQTWVDRLGQPLDYDGVVRDIAIPIEDLEDNVIIPDV